MAWRRRDRFTTTPSRVEVNVRAIPLLQPGGWRLLSIDEVHLIGAVPKDYLAYGAPRLAEGSARRTSLSLVSCGYIAKKGRFQADARECVTEEIISKVGAMLPVRIARSRLVRVAKDDVRFLSRDFVEDEHERLRHGGELAAAYFGATPDELAATFRLADRKRERQSYTVEHMLDDLYPKDSGALAVDFVKMLAFDAFIGAPNRHGMNWGVLEPRRPGRLPVRFAPIFDTARGLFVNHSDAELVGHLWCEDGDFVFRYEPSYEGPLIPEFPDREGPHKSEVLWPFFMVRMPPTSRKDVQEVMARINADDPLEVLAALGGVSVTNPYELRLVGEAAGST